MSQGFIDSADDRKTPEEIGHDYFIELLRRSFFQDIVKDNYGNIVRCRMHDLMHGPVQLVAGHNCISIDNADVKKIPEGARCASIVDVEDHGFDGSEREGRIKSLLVIGKAKWINVSNLDVPCLRNLRALRLKAIGVEVISDSIGKF